ncbi:MAG TPA: exodeoxyribonuclease VII small subunit [Candidatus Limnocylindrales bacterium]
MTPDPAPSATLRALPPERIAELPFDEALTELQRTVAALEAGGVTLEASIALYERGVALHERCATLLAQAELRVQRLMERAGGALDAVEQATGEDDS